MIANLGAGRLLRIQVERFSGEEQAEIVKCGGDFEMDGGDVHLWFEELGDAAPRRWRCWRHASGLGARPAIERGARHHGRRRR